MIPDNKHSHINQSTYNDNLKNSNWGKKFPNETKVDQELPALRLNVLTWLAVDNTGADNCAGEIDNTLNL